MKASKRIYDQDRMSAGRKQEIADNKRAIAKQIGEQVTEKLIADDLITWTIDDDLIDDITGKVTVTLRKPKS